MIKQLKRKIYLLLTPSEGGTVWDTVVNSFIVTLIFLNVVAVILETVDKLYSSYEHYFRLFEIISVIIFTIEYLLRIWSCTYNEKYRQPIVGRLKYVFSFPALIDLMAITPFYLPFATFDLRFVRLFRFLRFFKLGRYLNATKIISNVFKSKKEELQLCLILTIFLIVVASSFMYFVENKAQPDKFSSIPQTMWWCVTTLTTVGYGDVFPVTAIGRFLTAFIAILGIGLFALPTGILASGFSDEIQKKKREHEKCPHCGNILE